MFKSSMYRVVVLLMALVLLGGCGENPEPTSSNDRPLGDDPSGAPLRVGGTDTGILEDQGGYQPARYEPVPELEVPERGGPSLPAAEEAAAPGGGSDGEVSSVPTGADPAGEAERLARNLLADIESGEVAYVLDAFVAESVAALRENVDPLYDTYERFEAVLDAFEEQVGPDALEELRSGVRSDVAAGWEIGADEGGATLSTRLPTVLFGAQVPDVLLVRFVDDGWRLDLSEPLSSEDADEIRAFHEILQERLAMIAEDVRGGAIASGADLRDALAAALTTSLE